MQIPFNKPYLTGKETEYIQQAVERQHISGDGFFTRKCHQFFQERYGFKRCLLTTSCTDALEMCAILLNIEPGDEVIAPSYTFVSTVNAFVLRGAKIIFADTYASHPNINPAEIEPLITSRTKAIVVVHYAGVACDMEKILSIAQKYHLWVVEDAAQAIDSYYRNQPLGSLGALSAFSFHETKNIISGEGGMIVINDTQFEKRAEIIREKGTNRSAFFRGEIDKYGWVDIGSSFLPSDIIAAFLYAQLENLEKIQKRRIQIWQNYYNALSELAQQGKITLPYIPDYATNNGHLFYVVCNSLDERTALLSYLKERGIGAVFHYLALHKSSFYANKHDGRALPNTDKFADCLLRLPFYYEISAQEQEIVVKSIKEFYNT